MKKFFKAILAAVLLLFSMPVLWGVSDELKRPVFDENRLKTIALTNGYGFKFANA